MFGPRFVVYLSITKLFDWKPHIELLWGEPTHFYHPDTEDGSDIDFSKEVPLNKEYSLAIDWLWFMFNISLTKQHPRAKELNND